MVQGVKGGGKKASACVQARTGARWSARKGNLRHCGGSLCPGAHRRTLERKEWQNPGESGCHQLASNVQTTADSRGLESSMRALAEVSK